MALCLCHALSATVEVIPMTDIVSLPIAVWDPQVATTERELAIDTLERGDVLFFPDLAFAIEDGERPLLSPTHAGDGKNVSFDPATGALSGCHGSAADLSRLAGLMQRFAEASRSLVVGLLPGYASGLMRARTSFRPLEIAGRPSSWRKDDTRLHVDAFPSSPTRGERILRVFANVNPQGASRDWRLGEAFEDVARRFLPSMRAPLPGSARTLRLLHITKRERSAYDHYMLQLHDGMKADLGYQTQAVQRSFKFPAGSAWIVYSDLVSHAAMRGQYALEQTYHLPVNAMHDASRSPLRILERLVGRPLT
jgi:hypothetical protein